MSVRHVKQLDKMHLFLRKGQLLINPRKLMVRVQIPVILKKSSSPRNDAIEYKPNDGDMYEYHYAHLEEGEKPPEHNEEYKTFYKYYNTKKFKVRKQAFKIFLVKKHGSDWYEMKEQGSHEAVTITDADFELLAKVYRLKVEKLRKLD